MWEQYLEKGKIEFEAEADKIIITVDDGMCIRIGGAEFTLKQENTCCEITRFSIRYEGDILFDEEDKEFPKFYDIPRDKYKFNSELSVENDDGDRNTFVVKITFGDFILKISNNHNGYYPLNVHIDLDGNRIHTYNL